MGVQGIKANVWIFTSGFNRMTRAGSRPDPHFHLQRAPLIVLSIFISKGLHEIISMSKRGGHFVIFTLLYDNFLFFQLYLSVTPKTQCLCVHLPISYIIKVTEEKNLLLVTCAISTLKLSKATIKTFK